MQSCKNVPAAQLETNWKRLSGASWSKRANSNDGFECLLTGGTGIDCRAKPGTALYPTQVRTIFYSTGAKLKLGVQVFTAGMCEKALPLTFKGAVPTR